MGRRFKLLSNFRGDTHLPHPIGNPISTVLLTVLQKITGYLNAAISPLTMLIDRFYLYIQPHVFFSSSAAWPAQPGVITTAGHIQDCSHPLHRKTRAIVFDELVVHFGPFEKMTNAFFKMSRSWRRMSFSRCTRLSSSSAGLSLPLPGKGCSESSDSLFRQRDMAPLPIPRSRSTEAADRPSAVTRRTASLLNDSSYLFGEYFDFIDTPLLRFHLNKLKDKKQSLMFGVSIKSGTIQDRR
jgi:hypothetical protein